MGKCKKHGQIVEGKVFTVFLLQVVTGTGQGCTVVGKCYKDGSDLL